MYPPDRLSHTATTVGAMRFLTSKNRLIGWGGVGWGGGHDKYSIGEEDPKDDYDEMREQSQLSCDSTP